MQKITLFTICCVLAAHFCTAQKLPNKQEESFWVPSNIKIDGKINDWDNQFKAYNPGAGFFYSIANDNENVFFVIHTKDPHVTNTITGWGFVIMLQQTENKDDKGKVTISYPVVNPANSIGAARFMIPLAKTADTNKQNLTETMRKRNTQLAVLFKTIGIRGINGLDTLSVYNGEGIKAVCSFDENSAYTIEMAVPLKYLKGSINLKQPFYYSLNINGMPPKSPPAGSSQAFIDGWNKMQSMQSMEYSHHDFSGKYTLATK